MKIFAAIVIGLFIWSVKIVAEDEFQCGKHYDR